MATLYSFFSIYTSFLETVSTKLKFRYKEIKVAYDRTYSMTTHLLYYSRAKIADRISVRSPKVSFQFLDPRLPRSTMTTPFLYSTTFHSAIKMYLSLSASARGEGVFLTPSSQYSFSGMKAKMQVKE